MSEEKYIGQLIDSLGMANSIHLSDEIKPIAGPWSLKPGYTHVPFFF